MTKYSALDPHSWTSYIPDMICPQCQYPESKVLDTRVAKQGEIKRRRQCLKCSSRFNTLENIIYNNPYVIKKDGRREAFNKEKLKRGIQLACQKRPVSQATVDSVVDNISRRIQETGEKEVYSQTIGQSVIVELRKVDDVAYVRFASVYKTFKDIDEFVNTIKSPQAFDL